MGDILNKVSEYVNKLQTENLPAGCVYHNITHIEEVVEGAREIGENSGLSQEELEMVLISAWFHDSGLVKDYQNHEAASAEIAREFLQTNNYPEDKIAVVVKNILATTMPQQPSNLMEEVLCDADLVHIGKKGYNAKAELLRAEWEKMNNVKYTDFEWTKNNIDFITNNSFHTKYAKEKYNERRFTNLAKLQNKIKEELGVPPEIPGDKKEKNPDKSFDKRVARGIETMFRNTIRTHVEFSGLADNKANIMISVNTLLLTAIIAILARKLDNNPHLILPTAIITTVSLGTLIFAVLVTRPKITAGIFTAEDIEKKRANLLFFGNFYKMDLKDFQWGMNAMMNDRDFLYGSMIKDFYYLGQVLGQKYRYLRICYTIFMYGLIISVIAFTLAVTLYPGKTIIGPILE
ncbi:MAG: DUF5706 domain-containing protein [Ignavibacteriaceae bacterium]